MGLMKNNQPPAPPAPPSSSSLLIPVSTPHEIHPLPVYNPQTPCSGCGLRSSGVMFTCKTCSFTHLHQSCAEFHQACAKLPKSFTHPSHGGCPLSLTVFPGGVTFNCNGCRQPGNRWSYRCARCNYDLHISCVVKPLKIRHQAHTSCELSLIFKAPSVNFTGFMCNVCRKSESNEWRYRCNSCDFDVHLDCATGAPLSAATRI